MAAPSRALRIPRPRPRCDQSDRIDSLSAALLSGCCPGAVLVLFWCCPDAGGVVLARSETQSRRQQTLSKAPGQINPRWTPG
jgi:hypothetical protein